MRGILLTDSIDDETATPFAPVPEPPTLPQIGVAYFARVLLNYLAPMAVGYALDTVFRMELIQERSASANVAAQIGGQSRSPSQGSSSALSYVASSPRQG